MGFPTRPGIPGWLATLPPFVRLVSSNRILDMSKISNVFSLVGLCNAAPVGMGTEEVLDQSVRNCVQTDSSDVTVEFSSLHKVLCEVKETLTPFGSLSAEFMKVIVYREGDFFKAHKDAKKGDSHVLALAVDCGSPCKGGRVVFPNEKSAAEGRVGGAASMGGLVGGTSEVTGSAPNDFGDSGSPQGSSLNQGQTPLCLGLRGPPRVLVLLVALLVSSGGGGHRGTQGDCSLQHSLYGR
uniref:Prolyl 4-hydroxylase alpha subunit Fe(2+) 2OG dioxygenase domain-containing protein n=1 Tax=Chromera velia CCMP2878 TaxID=1169474 RepID=A0A0G4IBY5_9ALVE|eukprot:Cvel_2238.t1-p1 / transcript=Cvel_2238.t1 / gene=Cvel_2238 / organism=Chromera_velia_CCMP2878 / gene_product=hypothetical protein / transcript_product=hypothetical protein / location=Cvel_scaffold86:65647-66360(+) / protein_length=238 / sequence_SO=supercontig / SO=protein_coding / is_pseudo=false